MKSYKKSLQKEYIKYCILRPIAYFIKKYRCTRKLPWITYISLDEDCFDILESSNIEQSYFSKFTQKIAFRLDLIEKNCYSSNHGIFVGLTINEQGNNFMSIKQYMEHMHTFRHKSNSDGYIIVCSINLLQTSEKYIEKFRKAISIIQTINSAHKRKLPIYLIFNDIDSLPGFTEAFANINDNIISEPLGITIPYNIVQTSKSNISKMFNSLNQYIISLIPRMLEKETTSIYREQIMTFPQQIKMVFKKIIDSLMLLNEDNYGLQLRGIYFTNYRQNNHSNDKLRKYFNHAYNINANYIPPKFVTRKLYFLDILFQNIIIPEIKTINASRHLLKWRFKKKTFWVIVASIFFVSSILLLINFHHKSNNLYQIANNSNHIRYQLKSLSSDYSSIHQVIAILERYQETNINDNILNDIINFLTNVLNISKHNHIKHINKQQFVKALTKSFKNRIVNRFENLVQTSKSKNMLKQYLALSSNKLTNNKEIIDILEDDWKNNFSQNESDQVSFHKYLILLFSQKNVKYQINWDVVDNVYSHLKITNPILSIFGHINNLMLRHPSQLLFNRDNISKIHQAFKTKNNTSFQMPLIYTKNFFLNFTNNDLDKIIDQKSIDFFGENVHLHNHPKYSHDRIKSHILTKYRNQYIQFWDNLFQNIEIKQMSSIKSIINILDLLSNPDFGLLEEILNTLYNNTEHIKDLKTINPNLYELRKYNSKTSGDNHLNQIILTLQNIHKWLLQIDNSIHPEISFFEFVKEITQNTKMEHPLLNLKIQSKSYPQPIQGWLNAIHHSIFELVIAQSKQYIQKKWEQEVLSKWSEDKYSSYYPLNKDTTSELSLSEFKDFFSEKGFLYAFYHTYIKEFEQNYYQNWDFNFPNEVKIFWKNFEYISSAFLKNDKFIESSNTIIVNFLDDRINTFSMVFNAEKLIYQHGPKTKIKIIWPENTKFMYSFVGFENYISNVDYTGPWYWYKFLEKNNYKVLENKDILIKIKSKNYLATLLCQTSNINQLRALEKLHKFKLPQELFNVKK